MKHPKITTAGGSGYDSGFLVFGTWGLARFQGCSANMTYWSRIPASALYGSICIGA